MKKSLLAIVLLATGVTFANAQKKESKSTLKKAAKTETVKKGDLKAEEEYTEMSKAAEVESKVEDQNKTDTMEMKTVEATKISEDTLSTQKARKEIIE